MAVIAKSVEGGISIGADEVGGGGSRSRFGVSVRRSLENLELSNDFHCQ